MSIDHKNECSRCGCAGHRIEDCPDDPCSSAPVPGSAESRFSKFQIELAQQISNDIAEDIDNGHSRAQLKVAVDYWCSMYCEQSRLRAELQSKLEICRAAKGLMDVALPPNEKGQP